MKRREFLTVPAAALGGTLLYTLSREPLRLQAQTGGKDGMVKVPLRFFTADEARVVAAACERIFPSDASGPGAKEAGVVIYIDRQLAGPYGRDRYRYTGGPFIEDAPREFGYQGKATPRETYREGLKGLKGFDRLPPEEQDNQLRKIETSHFFSLLRQNTIEGMFCDPMHGGNVDMVGWQLVGFPGPRMSNYDDIEKHFGEAFRPKPASLRQTMVGNMRPSEDEK